MTQSQQEDYSVWQEEYQVVMPLEVGLRIREDEPVRLLSRIIEEMDCGKLNAVVNRREQKGKAISKHLLKVVVYGYMNGVTSSRKQEEACRYDIRYQWLLEGRKAPDHNTLARFRSGALTRVIEEIFYQLVRKLHELGEIGYENVYVDGTKIEAYANKYDFVFRKAVEKNEQKLNRKVKQFIEHVQKEYDAFGVEG